MRKLYLLILCFCLAMPVSASEAAARNYLALSFESPSGAQARLLLEELSRRNARATFFLRGDQLEQDPELAGMLLEAGHEIGIFGCCRGEQGPMSRRQIAAALSRDLSLLPPNCRVRFIRPPGEGWSVSLGQVADAMGFSLLDRTPSLRDWADRDGTAMAGSLLDRIRDGDVLALELDSDSDADVVLNTLDFLGERGFRFVTVSELARMRQIMLFPGVRYRNFPRKQMPEGE